MARGELPIPRDEPLMAPKSLHRKNVKQLLFDPVPADATALHGAYSNESSRFDILQEPRAKKHPRPAPLVNLSKAPATELGAGRLVSSLQDLELVGSPDDHNAEYVDTAAGSALGAAGRPGVHTKRQTIISSISPTKSVNTPLPRESKLIVSPLPSTPIATTSTSMNLRDEDLVHLKDLGSGNSGVVLKVLHVPLEKTMARKVVLIDSKLAVQTQIIRELRIMHECHSPYIIDFYGAFLRSNNSIVICMEYCNCGSLDKILQLCAPKKFPDFVLRKLLFSILSGLAYLYDTHKIIHRDIKPSNVLMTHKGEFKLCDFGVSRELTNSIAMADTFVGTSVYMSPERIQGLTYGIKSDVWSMGLMLYELASGRDVWSDDAEHDDDHDDAEHDDGHKDAPKPKTAGTKNAGPEGILDLLQRIVNEKSPTLAGKMDAASLGPFDPHLTSFIDACLIKNDCQRASPETLLLHPFLADVEAEEKKVKVWAKQIRKHHKGD